MVDCVVYTYNNQEEVAHYNSPSIEIRACDRMPKVLWQLVFSFFDLPKVLRDCMLISNYISSACDNTLFKRLTSRALLAKVTLELQPPTPYFLRFSLGISYLLLYMYICIQHDSGHANTS